MKILMKLRSQEEDLKDIAIQNLKLADKLLNLQLVIYASFGWLKSHVDTNFSHLETFLRENKLQTYLIAVESQNNYDYNLIHPDGKTECKYECIFSCRPPPYAMEELLETSGNYEDNFEKLKEAGSKTLISSSSEELRKNKSIKILSHFETTLSEKIINNELKMTIEQN
jgi:hypothetical protein